MLDLWSSLVWLERKAVLAILLGFQFLYNNFEIKLQLIWTESRTFEREEIFLNLSRSRKLLLVTSHVTSRSPGRCLSARRWPGPPWSPCSHLRSGTRSPSGRRSRTSRAGPTSAGSVPRSTRPTTAGTGGGESQPQSWWAPPHSVWDISAGFVSDSPRHHVGIKRRRLSVK